jgi:hypothetical protein
MDQGSDLDLVGQHPIEDGIAAEREAAQARIKLRPLAAYGGLLGKQATARLQLRQEALGRSFVVSAM